MLDSQVPHGLLCDRLNFTSHRRAKLNVVVPETLPEGIKVVLSGINVPEGPVWGPDGLLYFVSAGAGSIYRMRDDGTSELVASTGGRPNGLAFAGDGTLFVADAGRKAILRVGTGGGVETFTDQHESKAYGGPNDLCFMPNGDMLFTDPARLPLPDPCISPVFKAKPDGTVSVFVGDLAYPNGVDLSADGNSVYIAEMRAHRVVSFKLNADGTAGEEKLVKRFHEPSSPDGMAIDSEGRIFQALPGINSLALIGSSGELAELFYSPKWKPSNVAFGGDDLKTVFVTSESDGTIYSFRHTVAGIDLVTPSVSRKS
jgi:gluconolactonase